MVIAGLYTAKCRSLNNKNIAMKIQKPFVGDYRISQEFGVMHNVNGKQKAHQGLDWALPRRTAIYAVADGRITKAKKIFTAFGYGKEIIIAHKGFSSQYAHLDEILVKVGQNVLKGDYIGLSGNTGYVLAKPGYHLHFGIFDGLKYVDPLPHILSGVYGEKLKVTPMSIKTLSAKKRELVDQSLIYTVQKGDTLSDIANRFYNSSQYWTVIFARNNTCLDSPHKIYPGQKLVLPYLK